MKPSEAAEIVLMLMAAFPASKTLPTTSAVYECSLADLDAAVARKAVTRLIATRKWLPTVAEIRSAATDLRLGAVRDGGEAWKDAVAAVRYVGRYDVPAFPDPLAAPKLASVVPSTLPWTPLGLLPVMQTVPRQRPAEAPPRRYTADELQAALDAKQGAA